MHASESEILIKNILREVGTTDACFGVLTSLRNGVMTVSSCQIGPVLTRVLVH